jgi:AbrB family looped-hinge helix DNA binding protein
MAIAHSIDNRIGKWHSDNRVSIMAEYGRDPVQGKTRLTANGRIVIPAPIREQMGAQPGDWLCWDFADGVLRLETYPTRIQRIQSELAKYIPAGASLVDELLADRREEVRREEEELRRELEEERIRREGKIA